MPPKPPLNHIGRASWKLSFRGDIAGPVRIHVPPILDWLIARLEKFADLRQGQDVFFGICDGIGDGGECFTTYIEGRIVEIMGIRFVGNALLCFGMLPLGNEGIVCHRYERSILCALVFHLIEFLCF